MKPVSFECALARSFDRLSAAVVIASGVVTAQAVASAQTPPLDGPVWHLSATPSLAPLGAATTFVGDVDGDGFDDAVVTAPLYDSAVFPDAGRLDVYRGSASGLSTTPWVTLFGGSPFEGLGNGATAPVGDIDGDGHADLLVVSSHYAFSTNYSTAALELGAPTGLITAAWYVSAWGTSTSAYRAGDVNGDGFDDVLLEVITGNQQSGLICTVGLWNGSSAGLMVAPANWSLTGSSGFGYAVAHVGDVNGDGFGDIAFSDLSTPLPGSPIRGRALCWFGSATGPVDSGWNVVGGSADERFGSDLAGVGDVNGDGFDDVLVSAPYFGVDIGRVSLFYGSSSGLAPNAAWTITGQPGQRLGIGVAPAGDVDGDGYADFLVTANLGVARVMLFLGSPNGPALTPDQIVSSPNAAGASTRLSYPGDFDGDGLSDLLLGDAQYPLGGASAWRGQASVTNFCAGDGTASACPCGNVGASGHGCENSHATGGGILAVSGAAIVSADTLVLASSALPPSATCLYFQGTLRLGQGLGATFGDGLRCAGGSVVRLAIRASVSGASSYPAPGDVAISTRGAIPTVGGSRMYQVWYRDSASYCTPSANNTTNGVRVTWRP